MEITSIASFVDYLQKIHERTMRVAAVIPPDHLEWSYAEGKFTPGDLVRHIATTKRFVFAECAAGGKNSYPGCGRDLADGHAAVIAFAELLNQDSIEKIRTLDDRHLERKCESADGTPITVWKLLRAMVEHEIHHRGELYALLGMLGVNVPSLYGLTSERLRTLAVPAR
jgi:uncharacterized damage-inducible protein DinB